MPTITLPLTGLSHDGRAVGRMPDGMVVFVLDGLPGQTVKACLTKRKKKMAEAVLEEVITRAPEERPAPCVHATQCGGCPWQSLPYPEQLVWKQRLLRDALERIGRLAIPEEQLPPVLALPEANQWGYRNKMEFSFADDNGTARLGLRRRKDHAVVEVTDCRLQSPLAMSIINTLRSLVREKKLPAWNENIPPQANPGGSLRFVIIREPLATRENSDKQCLVEILTSPVGEKTPQAAAIRELGLALVESVPEITGFVHSTRTASSQIAYGEQTVFTFGDTTLTESLSLRGFAQPVQFQLDHGSFFQVNTRAAELLYNTATSLAYPDMPVESDKKGICWDVYCGVGGLTLALSPWNLEMLGLETVDGAVRLARRNAAPYGNCQFERMDAGDLDRAFQAHKLPNLICADPPRAGMAESTTKALLKHRPARLLLVSCNPATLARDLTLLSSAYQLEKIQGVDLFPQTPHVEAVALLTLKK